MKQNEIGDAALPLLSLVSLRSLDGYLVDARQPVALLVLQLNSKNEALCRKCTDAMWAGLAQAIGQPRSLEASVPGQIPEIVRQLMQAVSVVCLYSAAPVFMPSQVVEIRSKAPPMRQYELTVPWMGIQYGLLHELVNGLLKLVAPDATASAFNAAVQDVKKTIQSIEYAFMKGTNSPNFIAAANELNMPWRRISRDVIQFGWGSNSRWFSGSASDKTAVCSMSVVQNKLLTAHILREAGLPILPSAPVKNVDEAMSYALKVGFPVVIKPVDAERGEGVTPDIRNSREIEAAFERAKSSSANVMVEKHFEGLDYRIQVMNEKAYWVVQRVPASVMGDGSATFEELLANFNLEPYRQPGVGLKQVHFDDEVQFMLERQNLRRDSVVPSGQRVRLRRASNVSMGGTPVPIPLDQVHPDNLALAIRAARLLRLDLAGIDLMISDIGKSWIEVGAHICEVNAKPQLYPHLPKIILNEMVAHGGRIPVVFIIGELDQERFARLLGSELLKLARENGLAERERAYVGNEACGKSSQTAQSINILLADKNAKCVVAIFSKFAEVPVALPIDRIDGLFYLPGSQSEPLNTIEQRALKSLTKRARNCVLIQDSDLLALPMGGDLNWSSSSPLHAQTLMRQLIESAEVIHG